MEGVQLVQRDQIDVLLDELLRHEVPADVEVRAAPGEARPVDDPHRRNRPRDAVDLRLAKDLRRQQLPDRLKSVEHARSLLGPDGNAARGHGQLVPLVPESR